MMNPQEIFQAWKQAEENLDANLKRYGSKPAATSQEPTARQPLSLQELYAARQNNSPEWQQYIAQVESQWDQ
ncbi:hypothetical protein NIES4101_83540 [Calothrix sp. NIES-4101]|nr:hypothetical protein NIES4101_83540 [Calothrix sp. NIES-4101]